MVGLGELERLGTVLRAIVDGARVSSSASEIGALIGESIEYVDQSLTCLLNDGLVDCWGDPGQVVWTLTPIAAEGLRVHIVEYGLTGRSRWEGITFQPESISTRRRKNNSRVDDPIDDVVDPRPGPPEIAISDEESRRARPRGPWKVEHLPKPTLILMGCGLVWKERKKGSKKPCDVCKGLRLPTNAYCAKCSRWGLDAVVATRKSLARKNSRNKAS